MANNPGASIANIGGATQASVGGTSSSIVGDLFGGGVINAGISAVLGSMQNIVVSFFKAIPWIRIGETVLGIMLINIGLTQLAGFSPQKIVKTAAKAVL